jgi:hypothetical protein
MDVEALDEATQSLASRIGLVLAEFEIQLTTEDADAFSEAWLQFSHLEPPQLPQRLDLAQLGRLALSQLERFLLLAFVIPRHRVIELCVSILHGFWIILVVATREILQVDLALSCLAIALLPLLICFVSD